MNKNDRGGLVYSTEAGRMCPACRQPLTGCLCKAQAQAAAATSGDGVARVTREKQGRGRPHQQKARSADARAEGFHFVFSGLESRIGILHAFLEIFVL